ncbi:tryptophan synthase subunit alpha [Paenibacillus sp. SYP-B4298]|uniref:tryptophan synthase subunit alpha n=1 Tax=Paenibacillus sp. SYP-B4298 TaxID=2996034 RepID=UPI0022DD29DF|nr:tryptophan synthase subunit alpha [Paenibacillus sp. SYP-B4298]
MSHPILNPRNLEAWQAAKERGEALLIGYLIAGDPNAEEALDVMQEIVEAGIDIIELGIPSREPKLDGPIIQRGHGRAFAGGMDTEEALLAHCRQIRERLSVPIWAMGYKADVVGSGLYLKLVAEGLIDALVLPDCSLEDMVQVQQEVAGAEVDVVRFANGGMDDETLVRVCDGAGIIYAMSYAGTTGDPMANVTDLSGLCAKLRASLPDGMLVSGFGLRTPEKVGQAITSGFDGAVVGSALVARRENDEKDSLYRLVAEMKMETMTTHEG